MLWVGATPCIDSAPSGLVLTCLNSIFATVWAKEFSCVDRRPLLIYALSWIHTINQLRGVGVEGGTVSPFNQSGQAH